MENNKNNDHAPLHHFEYTWKRAVRTLFQFLMLIFYWA